MGHSKYHVKGKTIMFQVTFDSKVISISNRRRGSVPEPPSRDPPSPPTENIYETVLPCSSRESDGINGNEHLRG